MLEPTPPALHVCPGDSFLVYSDAPTSVRTNTRVLRGEYFRRLIIFDTSGHGWKPEEVRPVRGPTVVDRLFGRTLEARLICRPAPEVTMQQIVAELCSLVDNDPDDLYDQFVTHDELKQMFRQAATPQELIDIAARLGGAC